MSDQRSPSARFVREVTEGRRWPYALLIGLGLLALTLRLMSGPGHPVHEGCADGAADFCIFHGAALLAIDGRGVEALDPQAIAQASGNTDGSWFPWAYPPGTLLAMAPLGWLPAGWAWAAFALVSWGLWAMAVRPLADGHDRGWLLAVLAPALLPALFLGQMAVLWAAGLVAALWALAHGRAFAAGVFIGLLTMKPTLGLLIPVALLACGAWRTIAVAAATTLVLHGTATIVFGAAYWPAMLEIQSQHTARVLAALPNLDRMASLPALLADLGVVGSAALTAQAALTVLLIALVAIVWWPRLGADADLRAAVLAAAIPLATPYLWYYDAALSAVAALFLVRAGRARAGSADGVIVALLWVGPGLVLLAAMVAPGVTVPTPWLLVPLLGLGLWSAVRPGPRMWRAGT